MRYVSVALTANTETIVPVDKYIRVYPLVAKGILTIKNQERQGIENLVQGLSITFDKKSEAILYITSSQTETVYLAYTDDFAESIEGLAVKGVKGTIQVANLSSIFGNGDQFIVAPTQGGILRLLSYFIEATEGYELVNGEDFQEVWFTDSGATPVNTAIHHQWTPRPNVFPPFRTGHIVLPGDGFKLAGVNSSLGLYVSVDPNMGATPSGALNVTVFYVEE